MIPDHEQAIDPDIEAEQDPVETASLIDRLHAAGHVVRQCRDGGYLVSRWAQSRRCMDFESLQAFAKQVGVSVNPYGAKT